MIGTLGESWSYILQDGAGSTRQLVDKEGAVQLSISYTPWGDTLEVYGTGMLDIGYLGGVYDAGTGLIYMGNGQYYDPSTGRFLTRGANADQSNPYVPWGGDPSGMLIAPLALLALVFGRKKNRTKLDHFVILVVIGLSVGFSVSACGNGTPKGDPIIKMSTTAIPNSPEDAYSSTSTPVYAFGQAGANGIDLNDCDKEKLKFTLTPTLKVIMMFTKTPLPTATLSSDVFWRDDGRSYSGTGMRKLYDFYKDYKDLNNNPGFWNKNGFTIEKFFGLMMMYEMGPVLIAEPYLIAAASLQIWAHVEYNGDDLISAPYCRGTECTNGMFNFLAAYCESAQRRYDNVFVYKTFNPYDYPHTIYTKPEWTAEKAMRYIDEKSTFLGSTILNVPINSEYRIYTSDKAYHWGNLNGDYNDYIFRFNDFYVFSDAQRALIKEQPKKIN